MGGGMSRGCSGVPYVGSRPGLWIGYRKNPLNPPSEISNRNHCLNHNGLS